MSLASNPFAALVDTAAVLAACAKTGALSSLPVSAKRCADRPGRVAANDALEHDAAVEAQFEQAKAKAPVKNRRA